MDVEFADDDLDKLETDPSFNGGHSKAIVKVYRKRLAFIRASPDERAFYAMRSLNFEKLKGKRSHQYSMRLNDQWRLIVEVRKGNPKNTIIVIEIEDYHP